MGNRHLRMPITSRAWRIGSRGCTSARTTSRGPRCGEPLDLTAEVKDLKGEMQWLQLHIKREPAQERDPKRFRRELIVCAVVAVGATFIMLVTMIVLGNILREIAIETLEPLRVWWAG